MRAAAALLALALGCDGGSRLAPPETAPTGPPRAFDVSDVEVSGAQQPKVIGLYLDRVFSRATKLCHPEPGTTAELALTVDRHGRIAELGLRSEAAAAMECARAHLEKQRFPRSKGRTLVAARIRFLE